MQNLEQTILAQYANSPIMLQLINGMNQYLDPSANLANFYSQVWNVHTAVGYGLDRLGRVVGVSRVINIPNSVLDSQFKETSVGTPFGVAPMWDGTLTGSNYKLADSSYRTLILVKAISNITICSAQAINQMLTNLFGSQGRCYCQDRGNMQMAITFEFVLNVTNFYILTQSKALSRPSGVLAFLLTGYSTTGEVSLFREAGGTLPMGYGVFFAGNYHAITY